MAHCGACQLRDGLDLDGSYDAHTQVIGLGDVLPERVLLYGRSLAGGVGIGAVFWTGSQLAAVRPGLIGHLAVVCLLQLMRQRGRANNRLIMYRRDLPKD